MHVARGKVRVNGEQLGEGDGAAIESLGTIVLEGIDEAEVLAFDLAKLARTSRRVCGPVRLRYSP